MNALDIAEWAIGLMETLGAPGAGAAVALENVFPPLPSEVILPLAGFAASKGEVSLVGALVWTTLGSLAGALLLYGAGAALGRKRTRRLAERLPLVKVEDLDKAEAWFERHGTKAVLIGRLVPVVRSMISVPAGVERMPLPRFAILTALGSGVWNAVLIAAGYQLGEQYHLVERYVGILQTVVLVAVAAGLTWFVVAKLRGRDDDGVPAGQRGQED
jgi:membrane protein DedA with SNARE-associated domain